MNNWLIQLYRKLFCRGGHGVHSPFVFDIITTVIEEKCHYYCYDRLYPVRTQLLKRPQKVTIHARKMSIGKVITQHCFTEREDRLLFRLANRFQPKKILALGSDFGLTPLYLTAFSKDTSCIVIEPESEVAAIAAELIDKNASAPVEVRDNLTKADIAEKFDMIVWGSCCQLSVLAKADFQFSCQGTAINDRVAFNLESFKQLLSCIHDDSVLVIIGIHASKKSCETWKAVCSHRKVSVTLELDNLGVVFFKPNLQQRSYKANC